MTLFLIRQNFTFGCYEYISHMEQIQHENYDAITASNSTKTNFNPGNKDYIQRKSLEHFKNYEQNIKGKKIIANWGWKCIFQNYKGVHFQNGETNLRELRGTLNF